MYNVCAYMYSIYMYRPIERALHGVGRHDRHSMVTTVNVLGGAGFRECQKLNVAVRYISLFCSTPHHTLHVVSMYMYMYMKYM